VNPHSGVMSVASVVGVKAIGNVWVPAPVAAEVKAIMGEASGLAYLRDGLAAERKQAQELEGLEVAVARARLGIRSR